MTNSDVVIIGGGTAGLSAALVLARARRRVVIVDNGTPRNAPADHMHGYLSRDGMPPLELLATGRAEIEGYGGEFVTGTVERIEPGFTVHLDSRTLQARHILVTTGLHDDLPDIDGLRERFGKTVILCPYCHGYEFRDTPIAVIGGGLPGQSIHQSRLVRQWSKDVTLFPHTIEVADEDRAKLDAAGIAIAHGKVERLTDAGIELADGTVHPASAVFVASTMVPRDQALRELGCTEADSGWIAVDPFGRTSVPGVWAAGNVVDPKLVVVGAAAAGSMTAQMINMDLIDAGVYTP